MAVVDPSGDVRTLDVPVRQVIEKPVRRLCEGLRSARGGSGERPRRSGTAGGLFGGTARAVVLGGQAVAVLATAALALVVPAWASLVLVAAGLASVGFALGAGRMQGVGRDRSDRGRSFRGRSHRGRPSRAVRKYVVENVERNRA